jgi:hypothetical protein
MDPGAKGQRGVVRYENDMAQGMNPRCCFICSRPVMAGLSQASLWWWVVDSGASTSHPFVVGPRFESVPQSPPSPSHYGLGPAHTEALLCSAQPKTLWPDSPLDSLSTVSSLSLISPTRYSTLHPPLILPLLLLPLSLPPQRRSSQPHAHLQSAQSSNLTTKQTPRALTDRRQPEHLSLNLHPYETQQCRSRSRPGSAE